MSQFYTLNQFGPTDAIKLIAKRFSNLDALKDFNPSTLKDPRNQLSYGLNEAKKQWGKALRSEDVPDPEYDQCFVCKLDLSKENTWSSPQVEHLLPSAFAFLLFGLPGKFHFKWRDDKEESSRIIYTTAVEFGDLMNDLQVENYKWCHAYCNTIKRDSIFIKIVKVTDGCLDSSSDTCIVEINNGKDIVLNNSSISTFADKLLRSDSKAGGFWKQEFYGDADNIKRNINISFSDLVNKLRDYDEDTINVMIRFNLYVGLSIVYKYLKIPIPLSRANNIKSMKDDIKLAIENGGIMQGGGKEYMKEKLTKEEFELFLRIGEAIKYFSDIPYEGKEKDDAFLAEYINTEEYEEAPESKDLLEPVPLLFGNNMNGVKTPTRNKTRGTKRGRNNNNNNNSNNNDRNDGFVNNAGIVGKNRKNLFRNPLTNTKKMPRMEGVFRPSPISYPQIAGKYRKTKKNRKRTSRRS